MVVLSSPTTLGTVRNDHLFLDEKPPLLDNPLEFSNENWTIPGMELNGLLKVHRKMLLDFC
jgi:hypothetical protein